MDAGFLAGKGCGAGRAGTRRGYRVLFSSPACSRGIVDERGPFCNYFIFIVPSSVFSVHIDIHMYIATTQSR